MGWRPGGEEFTLDFALRSEVRANEGINDWLDTERRVW
jgi:hypothetical protein